MAYDDPSLSEFRGYFKAKEPGKRERNRYGFPPEYPKTLLGRYGLADMKRRRVMTIAIMFLLSLGASVACRLAFHK